MDAVKAPRWVWALVGLVAIGSVGSSAKFGYDQHAANDRLSENQAQLAAAVQCLNGFLAENKRISTIRATATAERDEADAKAEKTTSRLIDGIADLTLAPSGDDRGDALRYRQLLADYKADAAKNRAAALKLKGERARNPLPDLPAKCSDLPAASQ